MFNINPPQEEIFLGQVFPRIFRGKFLENFIETFFSKKNQLTSYKFNYDFSYFNILSFRKGYKAIVVKQSFYTVGKHGKHRQGNYICINSLATDARV